MRTKRTTRGLLVVMLGVIASSLAGAEQKPKLLNRSIYMPVEFRLCEHLGSAIFYENDAPVSAMPAARIFQFTYYPNLEVLLPEQVPIRVEGAYVDDDEPFTAKLAVTVDGIHTAHRFASTNTKAQLEKKLHKVDIRLAPKTLKLKCQRHCKRSKATTVAENDAPAPATPESP